MVRVNIDIPEKLHRQVKSQASLDGKTVRDYVIDSLKASMEGEYEDL